MKKIIYITFKEAKYTVDVAASDEGSGGGQIYLIISDQTLKERTHYAMSGKCWLITVQGKNQPTNQPTTIMQCDQ